MATLNYASKEIHVKVVYYGAAMSGKTTNLQVIHSTVSKDHRGNLISLTTDQDRTLFFDFLPLDLGRVQGFTTKVQLYTVPGQVYYNATRKLVLRGVDGIVLVVDSQKEQLDENKESLANLQENLKEYGLDLDTLPWIIQYNKQDLPNAMSVEELEKEVNTLGTPYTVASATENRGVKETLRLISGMVMQKLSAPNALREAEPASKDEPESALPPEPVQAESERRIPPVASPPSRRKWPPADMTAPKPSPPPRPSAVAAPASSNGSSAKPENLAIRQRSDVCWGKRRIGSASLELTSRSNIDGLGDYQLAESSKLLLLFNRAKLRTLRFEGEEIRYLNNRRATLQVFKAADANSDLIVWLTKDDEHNIFVRIGNGGRGLQFAPQGQSRMLIGLN